jgi:hypothetical protein
MGNGSSWVLKTLPQLIDQLLIPVANGGTGSTSFTSGSIPFSNGTILTQDNANFFWDDSNNRLGIGKSSPAVALDVVGAMTCTTTATANTFKSGYTTTATAAGTTTLTSSSTMQQYFTGTTTQTVVLPVTSTLALGWKYEIYNTSTGLVTVQSSGANTIRVLEPGSSVIVTCILTSGTGVASWSASHTALVSGSLYTNVQTGTSYTFALTDSGATVTASNASASTYTLPQTSNIAFPIGTRIKLVNLGAGAVTLVKEGSETLDGNALVAQYATAFIEKITTSKWQVFGGTATLPQSFNVAIVNTLVNDKVYDIVVPNFSGTITGLILRNTSAGTAGTYTAKINSTAITGLSAIANTTTRTLTAATAANAFVSGDVISYTPTGMTSVVDAFITVYYTRNY